MLEKLTEFALSFPPEFWTFAGAILVLYELIFLRRRILLFLGLSALTISLFTSYEIVRIENFFMQFVAFGILTIAWAAILWLPIHFKDKMRKRNRHLIGKTGQINRALTRGKSTELIIGREVFKARLQPDSALSEIAAKSIVKVANTMGGTIYVEPTSVPLPSAEELQQYRDHLAENPIQKEY